mmetsp:Transcript_18092/g.40671  ORF Transcript_18092/g.40671 Transcript_18092/m.40671 type:complete len:216 (+) Transcript_18092:530-1177(+)
MSQAHDCDANQQTRPCDLPDAGSAAPYSATNESITSCTNSSTSTPAPAAQAPYGTQDYDETSITDADDHTHRAPRAAPDDNATSSPRSSANQPPPCLDEVGDTAYFPAAVHPALAALVRDDLHGQDADSLHRGFALSAHTSTDLIDLVLQNHLPESSPMERARKRTSRFVTADVDNIYGQDSGDVSSVITGFWTAELEDFDMFMDETRLLRFHAP